MESILDWGVSVVLWFQQFSPALDMPFSFFTFLGDEEFYLLFLPFVYWCLDRRTGARMVVLFFISAYLNAVAKVLVDQPRPFQYDARVQMIREASGGGLPSGHTQNATAVWGYLATQFRQRWLWIVVAVLVICIPLSRVYLGVHFPQDLLGGYAIGAALLVLYLWLNPRVEHWLGGQGLARQLGLAVIVPVLTVLVFPTEDGVTAGAALMGMSVGFVLERRWVGFSVSDRWGKRIAAFALGIVVLVGLWGGLRAAFASLEPALLLRFIRYALIGSWAALGAPWVFVRLRLADLE